jgi:hypothetical protein
MGVARELIEPRSRVEYTADLRQRVQPDEASAALRRFESERAGLPRISAADARRYLEANHVRRPWLAAALDRSPEVQQIFAALDQAAGHAHIRHEGWVTEEMNKRRVAYLEDPAQLDPAKRAAGVDGTKSPERPHRCRGISSRITEADAFAAAFMHGIEHPAVKSALDTAFTPGYVPRPVSVDVNNLLGPDGHRYCTGWRLQPVAGSMEVAREQRAAWLAARAHGRGPDLPEPIARPVTTFADGTIVFAFGPTSARDRYEVITMYPRPRERE